MQAQASGLAAKLSDAEAALERNAEVRSQWHLLFCRGHVVTSNSRCRSAAAALAATASCNSMLATWAVYMTQANSALSMVEQEGYQAQLAAAQHTSESAQASVAAVRVHIAHKSAIDPHLYVDRRLMHVLAADNAIWNIPFLSERQAAMPVGRGSC